MLAEPGGRLESRLAALESWVRTIEGRDNHWAIWKSAQAFRRLQRDLVREGRIQEATAIARTLSNAASRRSNYRLLPLYWAANLQCEQGRFREAEELLEQVAESLTERGGADAPYEAEERAYYHCGMATLYRRRGLIDRGLLEWKAGVRAYTQALEGIERRFLVSQRLTLDRIELDLYLADGQNERVVRAAPQLVDAYVKDHGDITPANRRYLMRPTSAASHMLALRDAQWIDRALAIQDAVLAEDGTDRGERFEAAQRRADLCLAAGRYGQAAEALEVARRDALTALESALVVSLRARLALDSGQPVPDSLDAEWEDSFSALLAQWEGDIWGEHGTGFLQFTERRMVLYAGMQLARACHTDGGERAFQRYMRTEHLGSLTRSFGQGPKGQGDLDLARVRSELLAPGEVYFTPFLTNAGSLLFLLSADELIVVDAPPSVLHRQDLYDLTRLLAGSDLGGQGRSADLQACGERLGASYLPESALEILRRSRLVTLIEGGLAAPFPLQWMWMDGQPVAELVNLARVPSLLVESRMSRGTVTDARGGVVLVANVPSPGSVDPEIQAQLDPIDLSAQALAELTAPFPGATKHTLGSDGSEEQLAAGALGEARLAQIWAHGWANSYAGQPPALVLGSSSGGDGLWSVDEIEGCQVPPIIVLATCRAAGGAKRAGDRYSRDLGGAFLRAGAQAIVLARGDLPVEATYLLLSKLNASLADGASVSEALRVSAQAVSNSAGFEDPYFHAQLQVLGRGELRPFPKQGKRGDPWVVPAVAAAALLGIIVALLVRKKREEHPRGAPLA